MNSIVLACVLCQVWKKVQVLYTSIIAQHWVV